MENTATTNKETEKLKSESQLLAILKRLSYNRMAMVGLVILTLIILMAIFAPWIMPYDYSAMDPANAFQNPSWEHWLGTDSLGRDVLSRIIYGSRYSLVLAFGAVLLSLAGGVIIGAIAGFFGGAVDQVIMRCTDVIQAVPGTLLNLALVCVFGNGFGNTILALGVSGIASNARLMRSSILKVRKMEYLDAASSINCSNFRIITKHVLPNAFSPMIVSCTMSIGSTILSASGLSYLGLGVPTGVPEWGAMLSAGRDYIMKYPLLTIIPGCAIVITVLAANLLGDGLRDAMDPRLKK
ncbi:MAG: ABC transporter permease [Lachnospiraceae bacterium]|nr:ABC transporter permease [Lachnospiraceae bacterium]